MKRTITIEFTSIACIRCHAKIRFKKFCAANGFCECGGEKFDIVISATTVSRDMRDPGDAMARVAIGALAGGISGVAMIASAAGDECTEKREYEFFEFGRESILELAEQPPEVVVEFIRRARRESLKANLQPGQGICSECGEVFNIERAGFSTEGYCSKLCKRRADARNPAEEKQDAAPVPSAAVNCPKCSKPVKLKAGRVNKCIWCGTTVEGG